MRLAILALSVSLFSGQWAIAADENSLEFIDTSIENASPLWYQAAEDGTMEIHLNYDHERSSTNRASGHIHFQLQAKPGARLTLEFKNLDNIYNGRPGSIARELKSLVISPDGKNWRPAPTRTLPGERVLLDVDMPGAKLYVARVEPYRLSDLETWLASIKTNPLVDITPIGKTVEGRTLEIVRVGDPLAPYRVFVRARAHSWEAGSNWVVDGLVGRLLKGDDDARSFLKRYCVYVLPMANKDGVARGRSRFNLQGKDLNRNWDRPADAVLAPENDALETWLKGMIQKGQRPSLALEIHNDGNGTVHVSKPPPQYAGRYLEHMQEFEKLLRKHTWFTEGFVRLAANVGTLADGWLERYGIDAVVHEFNCQWIAGLKEPPTRRHWQRYGEDLARVLYEYFPARP
ncbi:MAG TPA: M14 family zinc carboxypeptidase [Gemmataceae bacterium]|jgi:hypothetical protein|nr:M14 family zinc carboxypeptidase [Gemmataceae bacterium]